MGYHDWKNVISILFVIEFIILFIGTMTYTKWVSALSIVLFILTVILDMVKCRCPGCGKFINTGPVDKFTHCPHCGEKL